MSSDKNQVLNVIKITRKNGTQNTKMDEKNENKNETRKNNSNRNRNEGEYEQRQIWPNQFHLQRIQVSPNFLFLRFRA